MVLLAALLALALLSVYVAWTAGRVDRLHTRAAAAGRALEAHLLRRAAAAAVLAERLRSPALYAVARAVLDGPAGDRESAENDLTRQLRAAAARGDVGEPVRAACRRVAVARQVHTDLVRDTLAVRDRRVVRLLGLARGHRRPAYFDIDDPALALAESPLPRLRAAAADRRAAPSGGQPPGPGARAAVAVKSATAQTTGG